MKKDTVEMTAILVEIAALCIIGGIGVYLMENAVEERIVAVFSWGVWPVIRSVLMFALILGIAGIVPIMIGGLHFLTMGDVLENKRKKIKIPFCIGTVIYSAAVIFGGGRFNGDVVVGLWVHVALGAAATVIAYIHSEMPDDVNPAPVKIHRNASPAPPLRESKSAKLAEKAAEEMIKERSKEEDYPETDYYDAY
jgi:hypothetical protein